MHDVFFIFYFSAYIRLLIATRFILKPLTAEKRYLQGSERPEFFFEGGFNPYCGNCRGVFTK